MGCRHKAEPDTRTHTMTLSFSTSRAPRLPRGAAVALAAVALFAPIAAVPAPADASYRTFSSANVTADGSGYLITGDRGENYAFGTMRSQTNPVGFTGRIADVAVTADGRGSLAISSSGQFYASGTATPQTNPTGFSGEMVAVALTADGRGAVAMSSVGQFYAYGTARPQKNPVGFSGRMTDLALTADGNGLVAMSSAGQLYAYGTATPQLNPTGFSGEMLGIDLTADGRGLLAVSSAGQFYAYGTAHAWHNPTGFTGRIIDVDMTADGRGAMAVSSIGQAYHYGSVVPRGNADPGTPNAPLGARIASLAMQQTFTEVGGNNCNPYSHFVGSGHTRCPAGQRSQAWCADFAKTIWIRSGARVSGLTPAASSFTRVAGYRPGATNNPRVGDAIVWGGGGHVGIVVEVSSPTRIRVTAGNVSNRVVTEWLDPRTKRYNGGGVVGYTTPSLA